MKMVSFVAHGPLVIINIIIIFIIIAIFIIIIVMNFSLLLPIVP